MNIKHWIIKTIRNYNPISFFTLRRMRKGIRNTTASFLCPNCLGGILFHDLGLQFRSPTVNLMIKQPDFAKFVLRLDHYLSQELQFFSHADYNFPCAKLDDITIHFTHYSSEQHASEKWRERAARLDRDNLFVFLIERDGLTEEEIRALGDLPVRGLVVLTAHDYPDIPYTLYLPNLVEDGQVGNILTMSAVTGLRKYECLFDFVKWFNEANGGPVFDIRPFRK